MNAVWFAHHADYLWFVLVSGGAMVGLHLALWRFQRDAAVPPLLWLVLVVTWVAGGFVVEHGGVEEQQRIIQHVSGLAATYAGELEQLGHAQIAPDTAPDNPRYLAMVAAENRWLKLNPTVSDIYTLRRVADGRVVFLVDSETDYDKDGRYVGDREKRTPLGEVVDKPRHELEAALQGRTEFAAEPYTDRWGHWVSAFVPLRDAQGRVEGVLGVDYDAGQWQRQIAAARGRWITIIAVLIIVQAGGATMTARLRAELARRRQSESTLELMQFSVDQAGDGVFWVSQDGELLYVNESASRQLGYSRAELLGMKIFNLDPDYQPGVWANHWQELKQQGTLTFETRHRSKSGRVFPIEVNANYVHLGGRELNFAFTRDITARKRAEEERARLSMAVEQAAESIIITDRDGAIVYVNPAFERVAGYHRAEVLGQNSRLLKSGKHDAEFYRVMWETITRGEVWSGHITNKRKNGTLYEEEAVISPVRNAAGRIVNYVAAKRDVTHERQIEAQLGQAQKVDAIGRLAGGVAHDFNNLLTVITGYCEMLLAELPPSGGHADSVQEIHKAAERAAALTQQLLAFSRKQARQPKTLDLGASVAGIEPMLRRLIGENIALLVKTSPDLGSVKADPSQIEQLLMNLSVNARDAMPGGGQIIIETANAVLDENYAAAHPDALPGEYVMIAVSDTGCGMSEEVTQHLFEPFFTTKPQGKGTGLGLATCHGIVKQSGGHIAVFSAPGLGTAFRIYLPRLATLAAAIPLPKPAAAMPGGHETILLVEDEPQLRDLAELVLTGLGYHVLAAEGGAQALEHLKQRSGKNVDLLLTDVVMPQMNGRELAEQIRTHQPTAKVLMMSGYTADVIGRQGILDAGIQLLEKPYTPSKLAQRVRETLDTQPSDFRA